MATVDPTPTRSEGRPPRRWPLAAVAASVVAMAIAAIALIVATRNDDTTPVDQPQPTVASTIEPVPTTAAATDLEAARSVVDEFFAVYNAGDTDAVMALLAPEAAVTEAYGTGVPDPSDVDGTVTRSDIENGFAWNHAQGEIWTEPRCERADEQLPGGTTLSCRWDTLDAVVQAVDGDVIPTNAIIVVSDDEISGLHRGFGLSDFGTLGARYQGWLEAYHPEVEEGAYCCSADTRAESERRGMLWAQWSQAWGDWLEAWGCSPTSCTIPAEQWVAEYDSRCAAGELATGLVAEMRLVPKGSGLSAITSGALLDADRELLDPALPDERVAELRQQRLEAMIELGIDERCHPVIE